MRDYLKSIALLASLFAALATGTLVTSQPQTTMQVAKASARAICGHGAPRAVAALCRKVARLRTGRMKRSVTRA